jgi:hypothetical protein
MALFKLAGNAGIQMGQKGRIFHADDAQACTADACRSGAVRKRRRFHRMAQRLADDALPKLAYPITGFTLGIPITEAWRINAGAQ